MKNEISNGFVLWRSITLLNYSLQNGNAVTESDLNKPENRPKKSPPWYIMLGLMIFFSSMAFPETDSRKEGTKGQPEKKVYNPQVVTGNTIVLN